MKDGASFQIAKTHTPERLVFGYANVSVAKDGRQFADLQEDTVDPDELEKAAYDFMLNFGTSGEMHVGDAVGKVVESCVLTPTKLEAMGISDCAKSLTPRWWIGVKVDEATFQKVLDGKYRMFSIQGSAQRVEVPSL